MQAMVISEAGDDLETSGRCSRQEQAARLGLALLEQRRTGWFNEVDRQITLLAGAAAGSAVVQAPRAIRRPVISPPAIKLRHRPSALPSHLLRNGRGLRIVAIAAALFVTYGLGWLGAAGLDWLNGVLSGRAAVDAVVERIISVESGGNPDAKNKRSSATGLGQFLDETWLDMIHAYRPDLAKGRSRDETLELRRQAKIAREMTRRFTEQNAAMLTRHGLPVTAGTLYLAHFAGGAGAIAILSAPADADAALVMANADATGRTKRDQLVKANPFLDHFSVADLKSWADRRMRGPDLRLTELLAASIKK